MPNKKQYVIVIPTHRPTIKWNEDVSLRRCKELYQNDEVVLLYPKGMSTAEFEKYNVIKKYVQLDPEYFSSDNMYNKMMMLPVAYEPFMDFEYMLIYQLDTFVFENNLGEWCERGYDYIGAPWLDAEFIITLKKKFPGIQRFINRVGNGGFSLRRISKFYYGSKFLRPLNMVWPAKAHEDFFWSSFAARLIPGFKIPDFDTALDFAFEEQPEKCFALNGNKLPFGCHAWEKFNTDFWRPHFKKYGYEI